MITIPVYNMIILPDISLTFKKDYFDEVVAARLNEGTKVLFLFQREEKSRKRLTGDDFYPIGLSGHVEAIDEDGDITVYTEDRMDIGTVTVSEHEIFAEASLRGEVQDVSAEERKKRLDALKARLFEFMQKFPWGLMARAYVNRWKSAEECATALSSYFGLEAEDKYRILEADRASQRIDLIEKAVYEFIAVSDVSSEAEEHAKENE